MKDLKTLNDEQLITETHRLAVVVSYYNAAEGNWSAETNDRNAAKNEFWAAMDEMKSRNLEFENKGYLL